MVPLLGFEPRTTAPFERADFANLSTGAYFQTESPLTGANCVLTVLDQDPVVVLILSRYRVLKSLRVEKLF